MNALTRTESTADRWEGIITGSRLCFSILDRLRPASAGPLAELRCANFNSHVALQTRVAGLIHRAHAVRADGGQDFVGARVKSQLTMLRFNGLVNRIGGPTDAGELVLV